MSPSRAAGRTPELEDLLAALPPERSVPAARTRIRAGNVREGRRFAVLDDDPTGSQSVHDVSIVTVLEPGEYRAALAEPGAVAFLLTNSRGLSEPDAVALNETIAADLFALEFESRADMTVISRSDSTLRGHVVAEVEALDRARQAARGTGYDGVLVVPAFFEAGRLTVGDIHWVTGSGRAVPASETEFAQDATFGYTSLGLPDFLREKGQGRVGRDDVTSITLTDIRTGGPERVAAILSGMSGRRYVVVNAACYADLEVVVLGVQQAEATGKRFLHRCGPSFVRALAGIEPAGPLTPARLARAQRDAGSGHGLVVVGSHVDTTTRQIESVRATGDLAEVEVDAAGLAAAETVDDAVADAVGRVRAAIGSADVLLYTSRTLIRAADAAESLAIARRISLGLVRVVREARDLRPAWVVAKGGITSHEIAVQALEIRRGSVLGQVLPGAVSVLIPEDGPPDVVGMPYVIFPGNVGGDDALADTVELLRAAQRVEPDEPSGIGAELGER